MANAKINRRSTGTKRPADVGGGEKVGYEMIFINTQTFLPRFTFMENRKKKFHGTEKGQNPEKEPEE